jgi:hypothetical protein
VVLFLERNFSGKVRFSKTSCKSMRWRKITGIKEGEKISYLREITILNIFIVLLMVIGDKEPYSLSRMVMR